MNACVCLYVVYIKHVFHISEINNIIDLHNYGGWLGKCEMCRAGHQEGQAGTLGHERKLPQVTFLFLEVSALLLWPVN